MPANPPRCEPPGQHRDQRWHWLRYFTAVGDEDAEPWLWLRSRGTWLDARGGVDVSPEQMAAFGYTYHSPAVPPAGGPDAR